MSQTLIVRATTSASNYHRRVRCPGSHRAEDGLAEENSEYAEEGTRLHAALESHPDKCDLDEKQMELVDSVREIFREAIEKTQAVMEIPPSTPFTEGYEKPLRIRNKLRTVMTGHCDYWRYYPTHKVLVIADAKFGFLEVTPAPLNLQLRSYAVMGWQEWDVETAIVAIAQPRAYMIENAEKLTIARYARADLVLAYEQMLEHEAAWLSPDAPRHASEDACRYCKAKLICPQFTARMTVARTMPASVADIPQDEFLRLYEGWNVANNESVGEQLKAEARTRCIEGRMPGYRLKENSPRRGITDPVQAARLLRSKLNMTDDELAEVSKISLGEVTRVVRQTAKTAKKPTVKEVTETVNALLAPVIELSTPQPSIVPISEHQQTLEG